MQKIIQIYPCLLKLLRTVNKTQFSILVIFQPKTKISPQNLCFKYFYVRTHPKIMIITSHMQKIIQIYPCLLKLLRKQGTILNIGDFSTKN
jgi:hypothetical protein